MIDTTLRDSEITRLKGEDGRLTDTSIIDGMDVSFSMLKDSHPQHPVLIRVEITGIAGGVTQLDVSPTHGVVRSGTSMNPAVYDPILDTIR